jgi:hypothetical protein
MNTPSTHRPKTTAEILAQQAENAKRQREAIQQKLPVPVQRQTAVTVPTARTAVQAYLDEVAPSSFSGRLVKFNKDGKFVTSDTGDVIDENTEFVALCDEVLVGWIKFNGENSPPDRVQGLLYEGFVMPLRETLGDTDPTKWETGLSGQPQDPFQHQMSLVLQDTTTHEIFTFSTTSQTGRRAVGDLLRHYERLRRADADLYPVIRLKPGGFDHKDPRVGWVATPKFVVVGKAPKNFAVKPDTSLANDMNDSLPF